MMGAKRTSDGSNKLSAIFGRFSEDENGATAIEYGLIVGLIFLAIIGAVTQYANGTSQMYSTIASAM